MSEAVLQPQGMIRNNRQAKAWTSAKVIYTGLMGFNLLSFLWLLATGSGIGMPMWIWIARILVVPLAISLGRLWKDKGFLILTAYFFFFFFRALIPDTGSIFSADVSESVLSALWLFAGCYGLGKILEKDVLKKFLFILSTIWTLGVLVYCGTALYAAWNDYHIYVNEECFLGLLHGRLMMIYAPTVAGAILCVTSLIIAICCLNVRNKLARAFFILSELPILLTLSMTDSRTGYVSLAVGMGLMVFITMIHSAKILKNQPKQKRIILAAACMILCVILVVLLVLQLAPAFNRIKTQGILPTARAEMPKVGWTTVEQRSLIGDSGLNGRMTVWSAVFDFMKQDPVRFLIGQSKHQPLRGVIEGYSHCHCLLLQILLESGVPGVVLALGFIVMTRIQSVRVIRDPEQPCWIRLLPAIIVALLALDMVESFVWLRSSQCFMNAVFFLSAGIIHSAASVKRGRISST